MSETELFLLEEGEVVQSFSGVDFNVLGYIPPFHQNSLDDDSQTTTPTGDVFMHRMASLQTMSISSTRDHKAARRLGSAWAFDFSRGSRTIAGSLIFALINGDAFKKFVDSTNQYAALSREDAGQYLPDAIPPFNIVFTASNESGRILVGMLIGVRITNTGMSFGIHDIYTEQVYSFVAERYEPINNLSDADVLTAVRLLNGSVGGPDPDLLSLQNGIEARVRFLYGDILWHRPYLPVVDRYTRGLPDISRVSPHFDVPMINPPRNDYISPADRIRRSKLGINRNTSTL